MNKYKITTESYNSFTGTTQQTHEVMADIYYIDQYGLHFYGENGRNRSAKASFKSWSSVKVIADG